MTSSKSSTSFSTLDIYFVSIVLWEFFFFFFDNLFSLGKLHFDFVLQAGCNFMFRLDSGGAWTIFVSMQIIVSKSV